MKSHCKTIATNPANIAPELTHIPAAAALVVATGRGGEGGVAVAELLVQLLVGPVAIPEAVGRVALLGGTGTPEGPGLGTGVS